LLHHHLIVQVKELFINEKSGKSHLVMEYVPLPSLESLLPHFVGDEKLTSELLRYLLTAVYHIHKHGICHRDLKPENILVSLEEIGGRKTIKRAVIIDLGVSKKY
jgi:serine/threonine protein kinase